MKNINNDNTVNNNNQADLSGAFFNDRVFQISPVQDIWPFCVFQAVVCEQSRQGPIKAYVLVTSDGYVVYDVCKQEMTDKL